MSTEIVPVDFNTELDRLADPAEFVIATVGRAKAWLASALEHGDIEQIVELKSQAEAMRVYSMSKQLGRDAELSAAEIVRRAERGLAILVRRGQGKGEINKVGTPIRSVGSNSGAASPDDYFSAPRERTESYAMADGVADEEFETAIAEAKEEGNLSRSNVVRKVSKKEKPVGQSTRFQIPTASGQRRALTAACTTLSGLAHGLRQVEDLHPDITSEEAAQWVGDLSEARLAIERVIKRLKERTNNGA